MELDFIKNKKILLIDDEKSIIELLTVILKEDNYTNIVSASSFKEGLELCRNEKPELGILDVMLPDGDGFMLLRKIREFTDIPVIFLTAKDEVQDKFSGFGLGADDYITKPFLPQEFLYRVNAVLRRSYKNEDSTIKLKGCSIDLSRASVIRGEEEIQLTAKEHDILECLIRNANRIVTIDSLCEAAWGENPYGYENSLMAHIRRIREKIEDNPSKPESLITVKGLGYKLVVEGR